MANQVEAQRKLTSKEVEVLALLAQGWSKKQIAERLFISIWTVKTHVKNIYSKLQVNNIVAACTKSGILKYP